METAGKQFRFRSRLVVLFFLLPHLLPAIEAEWKDQIIESQRFTMKYITTYGGRQSVDIQDPLWPEGISKVSGPYKAQKTVENADGTHATILQIIYTLRGSHSGIFTIPPLSVSDGITVQRSESLKVPILSKDEGFLRYPLLLDWADFPETLYTGQAFPLILMMENMEEISLPDSVSIKSPESALLEQVRGLGDIQYSLLGEDTLFHVPMQTWMLTPAKTGFLTLGSVEVNILGLTRKTEKKRINVIALPEDVSSKGGAIGDFSFSLHYPENKFTLNETVLLSVSLEGVGNLNYLELPEPLFPDAFTVVKKDNSDYQAMEKGFTGRREVQYLLTPEEEGNFTIGMPSFSWLNPENSKITRIPSKDIDITVQSLMKAVKDNHVSYVLLTAEDMLKGRKFSFYKEPLAYLLLLPGLLILILSRIRRIRKSLLLGSIVLPVLLLSSAMADEADQSWIAEAETYFESEDYDNALSLYIYSGGDWKNNWVFQYNKGLLHLLNDEKELGVASLRKALYMSNSNVQVRNTLKTFEENLGLENQIDLPLLFSPNLIFFLFILSVNLLFFSFAWLFLRNSSLSILFLLLFSLTSLGSGTELLRSIWLFNRNEGVIREDVALRKIPEAGGSFWITVPGGTSVELVSKYEDFILIRSAYGLEGWISKNDLILVNGDSLDEI